MTATSTLTRHSHLSVPFLCLWTWDFSFGLLWSLSTFILWKSTGRLFCRTSFSWVCASSWVNSGYTLLAGKSQKCHSVLFSAFCQETRGVHVFVSDDVNFDRLAKVASTIFPFNWEASFGGYMLIYLRVNYPSPHSFTSFQHPLLWCVPNGHFSASVLYT